MGLNFSGYLKSHEENLNNLKSHEENLNNLKSHEKNLWDSTI